jgi:polyhydroxyalkanoate synthesis regulator phasin
MPAHKPLPIEECLQQIQEAREQIRQIQEALNDKPDRDDLEHWSSELAFTMEELKDQVAMLNDKVDDLQSVDR